MDLGHVLSPEPSARPGSSRVTAGGSAFAPALAYSVLTPLYDLALEVLGFGRSFKAAVAELADVQPGEAVLDLGCGTGTLLQAFLAGRPDARFTGIDPDPRAPESSASGGGAGYLPGNGASIVFEPHLVSCAVDSG